MPRAKHVCPPRRTVQERAQLTAQYDCLAGVIESGQRVVPPSASRPLLSPPIRAPLTYVHGSPYTDTHSALSSRRACLYGHLFQLEHLLVLGAPRVISLQTATARH